MQECYRFHILDAYKCRGDIVHAANITVHRRRDLYWHAINIRDLIILFIYSGIHKVIRCLGRNRTMQLMLYLFYLLLTKE